MYPRNYYREHHVSQELQQRTSCIPGIHDPHHLRLPAHGVSILADFAMPLECFFPYGPHRLLRSRVRLLPAVHAVLSYTCTESLPNPVCRCQKSSIDRFLDHFCRSRPRRLPCPDQTWNGWTPLVRMAFFKLVSLIRPNINTHIPSQFIISQAHDSCYGLFSLP